MFNLSNVTINGGLVVGDNSMISNNNNCIPNNIKDELRGLKQENIASVCNVIAQVHGLDFTSCIKFAEGHKK